MKKRFVDIQVTSSKLAIVLICLLAGCATSYQKTGVTGGYSDSQIGPDEFIVYFAGNAYTDGERSRDYCMLRAAELTLQKGYTHFLILGDLARDGIAAGGRTAVTMPRNELKIKCFHSKPQGLVSYDAAFLQQSLKQKYKIS